MRSLSRLLLLALLCFVQIDEIYSEVDKKAASEEAAFYQSITVYFFI